MSDWSENTTNPLAKAAETSLGAAQGASVEMVKSRAAMEVMAAMAHAKKYPRDEAAAYARIMQACKRPGLAENATYAYTRGGSKIEGPSIRLAEVLAQAWGNINYGIIEATRTHEESELIAYAWDMETNTRRDIVFRVPHSRDTKQGKKALVDDRDVYENNANMGARRVRACILGVIPGDIVDDALGECTKTLTSGNTEPLADQVRKCVSAFAEVGVAAGMIERKVGHKLDALSPAELAKMRKVYMAIRDGFGTVADHFGDPTTGDTTGAAPAGGAKDVGDLKTKLAKKPGFDEAESRRLDAEAAKDK